MSACKMYGPTLKQGQCDRRVDKVLANLGLEACQHTKVRHTRNVLRIVG